MIQPARSATAFLFPVLSLLLCLVTACTMTNRDNANPATARECRTFETTGTKMKRSVCHTGEEWAALDEQAKVQEDDQDEFFRRALEQGAQTQAPAFDSPAF